MSRKASTPALAIVTEGDVLSAARKIGASLDTENLQYIMKELRLSAARAQLSLNYQLELLIRSARK